jgi:capsular polysaccharide biosynthesis protein
MSRSGARRWALLLALVLLGVGAGAAVALGVGATQQPRYRAEASLVVERGTQPLTGGAGSRGLVITIRDLAESATVSQAVITNLALHESVDAFRSRVRVTVDGESPVLLIRADASRRDRAQAIAQQLGLVVTQTVHQRFGQAAVGGEPVQAAVLDEAHALPGRVSPNVRRNLGWGALFGLIAGLLLANVVAARRPTTPAAEAPPLLGQVGPDGGFEQVAGALLSLAKQHPFQTVVVAGDDDAHASIGIARALTDRGETAAWALAADTDASAIDALAARNAFVLVAARELDARLAGHADAVVAVVPESQSQPPLELVLGVRGVRLLGTVIVAPNRESA